MKYVDGLLIRLPVGVVICIGRSSNGQPMTTPMRFSCAEIAQLTGQNENTVRSHLTQHGDVFVAEEPRGQRNQNLYGHHSLKKYELFLFLKSKYVRLKVADILKLLRGGKYELIEEAKSKDIDTVLVLINRFRSEGVI